MEEEDAVDVISVQPEVADFGASVEINGGRTWTSSEAAGDDVVGGNGVTLATGIRFVVVDVVVGGVVEDVVEGAPDVVVVGVVDGAVVGVVVDGVVGKVDDEVVDEVFDEDVVDDFKSVVNFDVDGTLVDGGVVGKGVADELLDVADDVVNDDVDGAADDRLSVANCDVDATDEDGNDAVDESVFGGFEVDILDHQDDEKGRVDAVGRARTPSFAVVVHHPDETVAMWSSTSSGRTFFVDVT